MIVSEQDEEFFCLSHAGIHLEQDGFPHQCLCFSRFYRVLSRITLFHLFSVPKILLLQETRLILFYLYFLHHTRDSVTGCHTSRDGSEGDSTGLGYQELPSNLSGRKNYFYEFRHYLMAIHVGSISTSSYPCKLSAFEQLQKINQPTLASAGLGPKPNSIYFLSSF